MTSFDPTQKSSSQTPVDMTRLSKSSTSKMLSLSNMKQKIKSIFSLSSVSLVGSAKASSPKSVKSKNELSSSELLRKTVNFSFKSKINNPNLSYEERRREAEIHENYDGQYRDQEGKRIRDECQDAKDFLQEARKSLPKQEIEGLERVVKQREILGEMANVIKKGIETENTKHVISTFQKQIDELAKPESKKVVHHPDGSTSFSVPLGHAKHLAIYEFKRDQNGQYSFIIHNRGEGNEDKIHGENEFKLNGKTYAKTSVTINVTKEMISDPQFLVKLYMGLGQKDMKMPYQAIDEFLIQKGGKVLESPLEQEINVMKEKKNESVRSLEDKRTEILAKMKTSDEPTQLELAKQLMNVNNQIQKEENKWNDLIAQKRKLLINEPGFHSVQQYDTCSESAISGPEKGMISSKTRDQLKLRTIKTLIDQVKTAKFDEKDSNNAWFVTERMALYRIDELRKKISSRE